MKNILVLTFLILASCSSRPNHLAVKQSPQERQSFEATASDFMVATQGTEASKAAIQIIKQGGNIIDAAIAASFVISVERPQSTGIGGGGFMIFFDAKTKKTYAIDFRERAPKKSHPKIFVDQKGEVIAGLSSEGALSIASPGLIAGLLEIHAKFGKLPRKLLLEAAINLAENGVVVYPHLANALKERQALLKKFPASAQIFLKADGSPYLVGEKLIQKDLAKTLRLIASSGASAFYKGTIAQAIVSEVRKNGGLLSLEDFQNYKVKWRQPITGTYKGYQLVSMPPPSSGGTHVIQILNTIEGDELNAENIYDPALIHIKASAMQQAFADRAKYMADPEFFKYIPLKNLVSKTYAKKIRSGIDPHHAKTASQVSAGTFSNSESTETTNFVIMDKSGNAVVSTQTINGWMGSGLVVPDTGILLNNEMDDFSAKPGSTNIYGAVGSTANAVAPYKTPLSSMAPTLVMKDNRAVMGLGAPGGTRIITCVAQSLWNYLGHGLPLYESISSLRIHHQWQPDQLDVEEPGLGKSATTELEKLGYKVNVGKVPCRVNAVAWENGLLKGVADPRDIGSAAGL